MELNIFESNTIEICSICKKSLFYFKRKTFLCKQVVYIGRMEENNPFTRSGLPQTGQYYESGETLNPKEQKLWGCLILTVILLLGPGIFLYEMQFKGTTLVASVSPDGKHKVKVVEKGSAFFFGSSKVRIRSGWRNTKRLISNDGGTLYPSNATIEWKSNDIALITLSGEEQQPEIIEYNAKTKRFETLQ